MSFARVFSHKVLLVALVSALVFGGCAERTQVFDPSPSPSLGVRGQTALEARRINDLDALPQVRNTADFGAITASSLPNDFQRIGAELPLSITFSKAMDRASVESAFVLSPPVQGEFLWQDNTVSFRPQQPYVAGNKYSVTLAGDIFDADGNELPDRYRREFEVTDRLEVLAIVPQDQEVSVDTDVSIIFNQPIAELGTIDELDSRDFGITVSPAFPFRYRLAGTSTLQIQGQMPEDSFRDTRTLTEGETVEHRLPRSSRLEFVIPAAFAALGGSTLEEEVRFSVRTPQIESIPNQSDEISPFSPYLLAFTQPVDLASARDSITILDETDTPIAVSIEYFRDDRDEVDQSRVAIFPETGFWQYRKGYKVEVDADIRGTEGNLTTAQNWQGGMVTAPFARLIAPFDSQRDGVRIGPTSPLVLAFDQPPVSLAAVQAALTIPEAPDFDLEYVQVCKDDHLFRPTPTDCEKVDDRRQIRVLFSAPLQNSTAYTLELAAGLAVTIEPDRYSTFPISPRWLGERWQKPFADELDFSVVPQPQIIGFDGKDGSYRELCFFSDLPLDAASIADAFRTTPELPNRKRLSIQSGRVPNQLFNNSDERFYGCDLPGHEGEEYVLIETGLAFETEYVVGLSAEARDIFGQSLAQAVSFPHRTKALQNEDIRLESVTPTLSVAPFAGEPHVIFRTENLPEAVTIDVCQTDIREVLRREGELYNRYSEQAWIPTKSSCLDYTQFSVPVPPRPWQEEFVTIDLKEVLGERYATGTYIVAAHHPRVLDTVFRERKETEVERYAFAVLQVTDLAVVTKTDQQQVTAWVSRMSDGSNVPEVMISTGNIDYAAFGKTAKFQSDPLGTTDANGLLQTELPTDTKPYAVILARAPDGDEVMLRSYGFRMLSQEEELITSYLIPDRSLYRPGDRVRGKAIFAYDHDADYAPVAEQDFVLSVYDTLYQPIVENIAYTTNGSGSLAFEFETPSDVPLGNLEFHFCLNDTEGLCFFHSVAIEEYKKPEYSVAIASDREDYFSGEVAALDLSARYFFGLPLASAEGDVSLSRLRYIFDRYDDEAGYRFSEDDRWLPYFSGERGIMPPFFPVPEQLEARSFALDENGDHRITVAIELPLVTPLPTETTTASSVGLAPIRASQTYSAQVTIADQNQNPVYAATDFVALATDRFVGIKTAAPSVEVDQPLAIRTVVVDKDGLPQADQRVRLTLVRERLQPSRPLPLSQDQPPESDIPSAEVIMTTETVSDASGKASYDFTPSPDKTGRYRVFAEVTDTQGRLHRSATDFFVYDGSPFLFDPDDHKRIELIPDKPLYQVGDTARITVLSPLDATLTNYLLSQQRHLLHEVRLVRFDTDPILELPITEAMIPNMHLSLIGQQFGAEPALALGTVDLRVDTAPKAIKVSISPDQDSYLPGAAVTLDITAEGASADAEVAVVVVDAANISLFDSLREEIMDFFWSPRADAVQSAMTLADLDKIGIGAYDGATFLQKSRGIGAGGMPTEMAAMVADEAEESMGMPPPAPRLPGGDDVKTRTDFRDTAYFNAIVPLSADGRAEVRFDLPDNLTTWSVLAIAVDKNFHVGETTRDIVATKPLLLRPQLPRFIRFGDLVEIRADVTNRSDEILNTTVRIDVTNIALEDEAERTVEIAAGETATLTWQVDAGTSRIDTAAEFTFVAASNGQQDAITLSVPVLRHASPETVATSGSVTTSPRSEKVRLPSTVIPELGSLTITTGATLANYLHGGLSTINEYPYHSHATLADRLAALVVYRRAMLIPNFEGRLPIPKVTDEYGNTVLYDAAIRNSIERLQNSQRADGGWGYWQESREADLLLTAKILATFALLAEEGIDFDQESLQAAERFLVEYLQSGTDLGDNRELDTTFEADRRGFVLASIARFDPTAEVSPLIDDLAKKTELLSLDGKLALIEVFQHTASNSEQKDRLLADVTARLQIDPRGMFLSQTDDDFGGFDAAASEALTARLLQILVRERDGISITDDPFVPKLLAWLIRVRVDGMWGSTATTTKVLEAFVAYLTISKEYLADYEAVVLADGREVELYRVDGESLFDTHTVIIGTPDILERNPQGLILEFLKNGGETGVLYYEMVLRYFLPITEIGAREEGIAIRRSFYAQDDDLQTSPLESAKVGDVLVGKLTVSVADDRRLVVVDSPLPAGMELINFRLKTSDKTLQNRGDTPPPVEPFLMMKGEMMEGFAAEAPPRIQIAPSVPAFDRGIVPIPYSLWVRTELKDDRLLLYADRLPTGVYEYEFFVRATHAGEFALPPTHAEEMETPEIFGRTAGGEFVIE